MSLPNYVKFGKTETVVTLAEDRGILKTNTYGEYFHRKFTDGRFCCAAPELERKLIDLGVRAGATVGITSERHGQSSIWIVRVIEAAPGPQAVQRRSWPNHPVKRPDAIPSQKYAAPAGELPPADLTEQLQASIEHVAAQKAAPGAPPSGPVTSLLTKCAIAAIDAAAAAEAYAVARGFPLKFREEQVQAWASTLYIGESKQSNINLMHRNETLRQNGGTPWRQ